MKQAALSLGGFHHLFFLVKRTWLPLQRRGCMSLWSCGLSTKAAWVGERAALSTAWVLAPRPGSVRLQPSCPVSSLQCVLWAGGLVGETEVG